MDEKSIFDNCCTDEVTLELGNCHDLEIETFVAFFNLQKYKNLCLMNSDIQDSDVQKFAGIINTDNLDLKNCNNITDQGLIELVQIIKPENLTISYCPNITNHGIQKCKDIINTDPKPEPAKPKPASSLNAPTTQCISERQKNL